MKLVIDLDSHSAIADFGNRSPAGGYTFKSQDTIDFQFYFVQAGVVQDLGASFAMKFGMIKTGDVTNTILAYQTACTYLTDANGNVYYQMQVVMNTSQMATAIGTNPSISCIIEVRYQDALNEIIHTLNIPATVFATILVETGVTPPGVSTGYPDASTIELLVHKNAANGYAGLNASTLLPASIIPVDTQTIITNSNGQIALSAILANVAANFTTPVAQGTVTITLNSTTNLKANQYVRIPVAGYYVVESITDATHAVVQNNGDPYNASSGVTISSGAVLLPAQAAAGGGGTPGQAAYTTTTASFTVPAAGATVSVAMGATNWLGSSGYVVFITGAGYYAVSSVTDATDAVLTNLGYSATNVASGTIIATGAKISAGGIQGPTAATGASGANAYDATTANFTMPAAAASVSIAINNTAWLGVGQEIYIAGAGYFSVASITSPTIFSGTNSNYPGAAAPGATIASGVKVSVAGVIGPQGAGGPGLNAFTTLTSNFTQPAVNAAVTVNVGTTAWMAPNQGIYIQGGGYYSINTVGDLTHVTVVNLGSAGNAAPGLVVTGSGTQMVSPAGVPGVTGIGSYTTVTASFVMPATSASVTIAMAATQFIQQNQNIFVAGAGYFTIASITDATHVAATNLGAIGNVSSGTTIPSGAGVTTAGAIGPTGAVGPTGPAGGIGEAPTDGQIYGRQSSAWVVAGGGGGGGPILPSARIFDFDDFDSFIQTVNGPNGKLQWKCSATGSGTIAAASSTGHNSTDKARGVWDLSVAAAADGIAVSLGDPTATSGLKPTIVPGLGILQMEWRFNIGALPTGTDDLRIDCGLCNNLSSFTGVSPGDGIYFFYWYGNSITNWQATTMASSASTATTTGVAATATGFHKFQLLTNAGWTSIQFLIDGVVKATNTAHIPTVNLCPFFRVCRGNNPVGTLHTYVDYYYNDYQYTR